MCRASAEKLSRSGDLRIRMACLRAATVSLSRMSTGATRLLSSESPRTRQLMCSFTEVLELMICVQVKRLGKEGGAKTFQIMMT
jgi:hypothetical protein